MNICLVNPPSTFQKDVLVHSVSQGIYLIGTVLKNQGHNVTLFDQFSFMKNMDNRTISIDEVIFDSDLENAIADTAVLGLSCDACNYGMAKKIISRAKKLNSNVKIIMGGVHSSMLDDYIIRTSGADIVLRGEGEGRIVEILERIENGKPLDDIFGITFRRSNGELKRTVDAPQLLLSDKANHVLIDYKLNRNFMHPLRIPIETSRGCLFNCNFCSILHKHQRRLFPLEYVKDCILNASRHNKNILITDDCFTTEIERAKSILTFLNDLDSMSYYFEARVNDLCRRDCTFLEDLDPVKTTGFQVGVECGYDEGLKRIGKGIRISQVETACRRLKEKNLQDKANLSFIVAFPWEGKRECGTTIEFAIRMKSEYGVNAQLNTWYPSPSDLWYETKEQFNVDESMYDQIGWFYSEEIFKKTHPNIDFKTKMKIDYIQAEHFTS